MGKRLIISGVDFSTSAIAIAKAVDNTPSTQYVYVANVVNPTGNFDWNAHKVEIHVNNDVITSFNLPDDTIAIPKLVSGGSGTNNWLSEIDITYLSDYPLISFKAMLAYASALKQVKIGGKFPSLTGSDAVRDMFYGCSALEEVVIDDSFEAPNLDSLSFMFYTSSSLTSSVKSIKGLKNLITSSIHDLSNMFDGCKDLRDIDLTNCNTSNVTSFESMFRECSSLVSISGLNELDTSRVTNFTRTFAKSRVNHLDVSNWVISSDAPTTRMFSQMFCVELNANCFTSLSGDISSMFYIREWNTIHLDNLNDVSAVTTSDNLFSNYVVGVPKVTIANVTNEAVKTFLKSKLNAVSAGGSSDWQEATVDGVLCLVPSIS